MLSYIIFQRYDRSLKLEEITAAVVEELRMKCAECGSGIVDRPSFVCYPESPSHVTYRARLEGTSERESDSLISLIEDWVRGGPGVIVTGVLMTVDRHCSVAISFLSERECLPPHANTTDPPIITDPPITDPPITDPPNATTEDPNTDPPVTDPITDPTATVIGGIATPDTGATPETIYYWNNSRSSSGSCYCPHHCHHNCHCRHSFSGVKESSWGVCSEEIGQKVCSLLYTVSSPL